jgi:DNA-binding GntR family transcriptional regulator
LQAFDILTSEGYLVGKIGSGTRVARPRPNTYLFDLPRPTPITRKSLHQTVRESFYPSTTAALKDPDGNILYLFTSDSPKYPGG